MKVESSKDVRSTQSLDQPAIATASSLVPTKLDQIAQLFDQEVVANNRALNQRSLAVRVPPVEQLAQLYEQLGHPGQATLASISRRIRQQLSPDLSTEKLVELAGGDPARAFLVLKHMAAMADTDARPSEAALARDTLVRLEVRFKGEIQAGLNIAAALVAADVAPEQRQALRSLYYASVVTRQSLATMMQALLREYGGEGLSSGLNIMRKALADDIAALVSSVPTARLRTLLLGLQSCGQLGGVLANCKALILRLSLEQDAVMLLQRLLGYAGSGIEAAEVLRLAHDLGGSTSPRDLIVLNGVYPLIQQLPLALWRDGRAREEFLNYFMVVLNELASIERGSAGRSNKPRPLA